MHELRGKLLSASMNLNYRLLLNPESPEQRVAAETGEYDTAILRQIMRVLSPASTCIEIGAGFGGYTCAIGMQMRGSQAHLHAFEPDPVLANLLEQNIQLNELQQHVSLTPSALGNKAGQGNLHPAGPMVNYLRLDDWATEQALQRCDMIRLGTRRTQLAIIEGGRNLIERLRPIVIGRLDPSLPGGAANELINFFQPMRYICFREFENRFYPLSAVTGDAPGRDSTCLLIPLERMRWAGFDWGFSDSPLYGSF